MHGNDRADQKRRSYSVQLRAKKWWKPLFNWLVDYAAINAHLLYQQLFQEKLDRKIFMLSLCNYMCKIEENVESRESDSESGQNSMQTDGYLQGLNSKMNGNHCMLSTKLLHGANSSFSNIKKSGYCMVHKHFHQKKLCEYYCVGCKCYFHLDCYHLYHHRARIYMENNEVFSE